MEISLVYVTLLPIIIGIVAAIKKAGIPSKLLPLAAIILGVVGVFFYNGQHTEWIAGIVIGLSSVGLYAGTKSAVSE